MQIAMIGTGYVGLVTGTCLSEFGSTVICVDKDQSKIDRLRRGDIPIYEPGLEQLVTHNVAAGRLSFTTSIGEAVRESDAVFIAVGTPTSEADSRADLSNVHAVAREIAEAMAGYIVVVTKSTVPVGTCRGLAGMIKSLRPNADFDMVSNPEFLREGSAINDFMRPDRVVIGAESDRAREVMSHLYRPLDLKDTPILFTSLESAELVKYAANAFLATKISFINEVADLCEAIDGDIQDVAKGIGLDPRIGGQFLNPGPGYGGSCFPKDTVALASAAKDLGTRTRIIEAVVEVNDRRKKRMAGKVIEHCGGSVDGKTIAILGLTFKPNTDDMRDAPSLDIVPLLQEAGAALRLFDPEGMNEARRCLSNATWCENAYQAMDGADALVILTEWNEFRALDMERVKNLLRTPVMIDLRNIYDPQEMAALGFYYRCVGRPYVETHPVEPASLKVGTGA